MRKILGDLMFDELELYHPVLLKIGEPINKYILVGIFPSCKKWVTPNMENKLKLLLDFPKKTRKRELLAYLISTYSLYLSNRY